jgi:hypothetical protein
MTSSFDPNIDHISSKDYKNIYQPNTDTFIFVDSLEQEQDFILKEIDPKICFEIGFGKKLYSLLKIRKWLYYYIFIKNVDEKFKTIHKFLL